MPLPRKALIAISSAHPKFHADGSHTGFWYAEALHPYQTFTDAGFEVIIASENGDYACDQMSLAPQVNSDDDNKVIEDTEHPFNRQLHGHVFSASDLTPTDFGIFFAAGGHGAAYDFPHGSALQSIAQSVYTRGGPVAAVCHGPTIYEGIKSNAGHSIIKDRTITGFPVEGELEMKVLDQLHEDNVPSVEDIAEHTGATYEPPESTFAEKQSIDAQIVTGANPASSRGTAENAIKVYEKNSD
ncbi:ThiJ/PfpI family protein [Ascosphaera apis ARSEF 7405]|uniref:D-lactate dehydratase n=1 Tax=Ascosphaera apis ARSEF 7405 TaxID=392613 RepID=A0A168A9H7_9EURO|nr:ThiJ/PfpI family protein [Ascosphaera apis ARSEF 7405]